MKRLIVTASLVALLLGTALAGVLASGCGGGSGVPSDAVATVGGVSITKAQFDELMAQAKTQLKTQGQTMPSEGSSEYDVYKAQLVDYLVSVELAKQSAAALGVSVTDAQIDQHIASYQKSAGGEKKLLELLKAQGMTLDSFKSTLKSQLLLQAVATAAVKQATVSDAEIEAYWNAHKANLVKDAATATFAKAKSTLRTTLLDAKKQALWVEWLKKRTAELGVEYAAGFDPTQLLPSPSPSVSASASPASSGS